MPGFVPLEVLWQGESPAFHSEASARWALRQHRAALIEASALARLAGRLLVHRERFAKTIEAEAIRAARQYRQPA